MTTRRRHRKDYAGTTLAATLLAAFGIAFSLIAFCTLLGGLVLLVDDDAGKQVLGGTLALASLGSLVTSLLVLAAGLALGVLRDIARQTA